MLKSSPHQLALDLIDRSICAVGVAAVIFDNHGIVGWGWNSMGSDGYGEHAEVAAIRRCNRNRLDGSSIVVVGRRKRNQKFVVAFPCINCQARLIKVNITNITLMNTNGWFKVRI